MKKGVDIEEVTYNIGYISGIGASEAIKLINPKVKVLSEKCINGKKK